MACKPHKTLLLPDVQMHAGIIRKINRGLKPPRYKVAISAHKEKDRLNDTMKITYF